MGKKPVVGIIGLLWAGIALTGTGCGTCQSCHNKYKAQPAFPMKQSSSQPPAGTVIPGDQSSALPSNAIQSVPMVPGGNPGFATGGNSPMGNQTTDKPVGTADPRLNAPPVGSPPVQESLRPRERDFGNGTPVSQMQETGSEATSFNTGRRLPTGVDQNRMNMPALPVTRTVGQNTGMTEISSGSNTTRFGGMKDPEPTGSSLPSPTVQNLAPSTNMTPPAPGIPAAPPMPTNPPRLMGEPLPPVSETTGNALPPVPGSLPGVPGVN